MVPGSTTLIAGSRSPRHVPDSGVDDLAWSVATCGDEQRDEDDRDLDVDGPRRSETVCPMKPNTTDTREDHE
jgi:hypothetical protein